MLGARVGGCKGAKATRVQGYMDEKYLLGYMRGPPWTGDEGREGRGLPTSTSRYISFWYLLVCSYRPQEVHLNVAFTGGIRAGTARAAGFKRSPHMYPLGTYVL